MKILKQAKGRGLRFRIPLMLRNPEGASFRECYLLVGQESVYIITDNTNSTPASINTHSMVLQGSLGGNTDVVGIT